MSSFLHKSAVIATLATRTGLKRSEVEKVLATYATVISEELVTHGGINLPGIGRAKAVARKPVAARTLINPKTRKPIKVPATPARTTYKAKFGRTFLKNLEKIQASATNPVASR